MSAAVELGLEAAEPPPARDEVRLLIANPGRPDLVHTRFRELPEHLRAGDLLVVNASATLPAALPARRMDGTELDLHLSTPDPSGGGRAAEPSGGGRAPDPSGGGRAAEPSGGGRAPDPSGRGRAAEPSGGRRAPDPSGGGRAAEPSGGGSGARWVVELRKDGGRFRGAKAGERLALPGGGGVRLLAPYLSPGRLWIAKLDLPAPLGDYLAGHGAPIRYRHQAEPRPLADYQTIFAREPGSAEMPSAARPFTRRVLEALDVKGVGIAEIVLHTGVSSLERGERPYPERFRVNAASAAGRRVIAVGTTVVRALETATTHDGTVRAAQGWTSLVITPDRGVRAVDGLVTGWHDRESTHLDLLEAVGGRALIERSYAAALAHDYRWHEFGDSHLILR